MFTKKLPITKGIAIGQHTATMLLTLLQRPHPLTLPFERLTTRLGPPVSICFSPPAGDAHMEKLPAQAQFDHVQY